MLRLIGSRTFSTTALSQFFKEVLRQNCSARTIRFAHKPASKIPFTMKIDSLEFQSLFTPALKKLLSVFNQHNYEIRMAGGAVRDILRGSIPKDVDFATTATPEEMKTMFTAEDIRMINVNGEKHGTITARIDNENFEVTTLRIDVTTDGRHAEVEFTKDWELDANRRDLTINSMFLGVDGTVYDYFDGYKDLQKNRVVFVNDPNKRIQEDYLRILRYFRFFARVSNDPDSHEEETLRAISSNIAGLERITGERIWMELSKILSGKYVPQMMTKLHEIGACKYLGLPPEPNLPELWCVAKRTEGLEPHPVTLLVSLFKSDSDMMDCRNRLKFSNVDRDLGRFIITFRNDNLDLASLKKMMFRPEKTANTRLYILELLKYSSNLLLLDEFGKWEVPKFPLSGNVLKENNVPGGIALGEVLKALKQSWIDSDYSKTTDDLLNELPEVMKKLNLNYTKNINA